MDAPGHELAGRLRDLATMAERGALPADLRARLAAVADSHAARLARRDAWLRIAARHVEGSPTQLYRALRRIQRFGLPPHPRPLEAAIDNALALGPAPGRRRLAQILATHPAEGCQNVVALSRGW